MKVLALTSYPIEAAATRYRLAQFVAPLRERGITLTLRPFMDSRLLQSLYRPAQMPRTALGLSRAALRRFTDVWQASRADVLLVQREAMMFGPPVIEWLATRAARCPMILDLDDATYVRYVSPTYGRLASALKWFSKTDDLIRWAKVVTCGNSSIARYVSAKGARAIIIPTVVDTDLFRPTEAGESSGPPVLGWIGTHSTYPFLESIFPALQRLAQTHRFRLKVVGAGRDHINLPGVEVETLDWSMEREISDFQSFDIGLYPIVMDEWSQGKSGFKAIQYMSVGIPYVVTPVGACAEIGEPGATHFEAVTQDEWHDRLAALLSDRTMRKSMGETGRRHALRYYTLPEQTEKLVLALREAAAGRGQKSRRVEP